MTGSSVSSEKPHGDGGYISGGFFVLSPDVLDLIDGDATLFEKEPLEHLAAEGELMAFRHEGFWQPMDTMRDKLHLEDLWAAGGAVEKVVSGRLPSPAFWRGQRVFLTGHTGFKGGWAAVWLRLLGAEAGRLFALRRSTTPSTCSRRSACRSALIDSQASAMCAIWPRCETLCSRSARRSSCTWPRSRWCARPTPIR